MIYPIKFTITLSEAQVIEMSLRGSEISDFELKTRRKLLKEVGRCLVDESDGYVMLWSEDDVWFLRDNLNPDIAVGDYNGLTIITRLYPILVGYGVNWTRPIEVENDARDEDENETESKSDSERRPVEEIES
jgi:hypothetical protein